MLSLLNKTFKQAGVAVDTVYTKTGLVIMSLYAIDKLIDETRRLAAEFRRSTGTMLPVSGEIARYDVAHHLNLVLCEDRNCGFDAVGQHEYEGMRVLIKSRVIGDCVKSGHRIGQINPDANWDMIALSLMNSDFEPVEMYQASREDIVQALAENTNNNRKKRGAISVAKFKIIAKLVWTSELGLMDNTPVYTDNQYQQR